MEDVVELEMLCNSYLLLGPELRTLAFLKVRVVEAGINKTNPQNISFKGSSQPKASPHMRNLKYRGRYSNYKQPNNRSIRLRKKKPSYTLFNMDNFTMGNQMFALSHHLLYYFINLYLHVLIILNPPLPPLNDNRK